MPCTETYVLSWMSQRPLNSTLLEIEAFLALNPNEVVTIFLEDYVHTSGALTNAFKAANLTQYMFPLASMPTDGSDWPTLSAMIAKNERLLVFTSDKTKQAGEGIAYEWNFVVENQCKLTILYLEIHIWLSGNVYLVQNCLANISWVRKLDVLRFLTSSVSFLSSINRSQQNLKFGCFQITAERIIH